MKKSIHALLMAALAVMGAILMGCAESDLATEAPQLRDNHSVTLTTTICLDGRSQTRALSASGVKTFSAGTGVAVFYKNTSGESKRVVSNRLATADISGEGKIATITVTLEDPEASSDLRMIYPDNMANTIDDKTLSVYDDRYINFSLLNKSQDGTLETLGNSWDLSVFDGSLTADAKLPDNVHMTNPLAIGAFTIKDEDGADITNDVKHLTISDGTNSYIIDRTPAAGPIYVAMRPVVNKDFELTALTSTTPYIKNVSGQTLTAGSLYPINVKMEIDKELCTPLTIEALTDGYITVTNEHMKMKYSVNGGEKQFVYTFSNHSLYVNKGDKVAFYGPDPNWDGTMIGGQGSMKVYGNIMSLVNETDFASITTLTKDRAFYKLFGVDSNSLIGNMMLTDASGLRLPATTLTERCYQGMFYKCVNLTAAPEKLPATKLANFCYLSMFEGCSKLTTTPKLPATTLANYCYNSMFYQCTSLTKAYVKAAYTNSNSECTNMFANCTNATGRTFYSADTGTADTWKTTFGLSSWTSDIYPE